MDAVARLLIFGGVAFAVIGGLLWLGAKAGLGRLPGDIVFERGNVTVVAPIVTSIVLSLLLTIVLNVVLRVSR
jgi:hypothetical protein